MANGGDHGLLLLQVVLLVLQQVLLVVLLVGGRVVMRMRRMRRSCVYGYGEKGGPTERTGFRVYVDFDRSGCDTVTNVTWRGLRKPAVAALYCVVQWRLLRTDRAVNFQNKRKKYATVQNFVLLYGYDGTTYGGGK